MIRLEDESPTQYTPRSGFHDRGFVKLEVCHHVYFTSTSASRTHTIPWAIDGGTLDTRV